jgi:hypothetical protein
MEEFYTSTRSEGNRELDSRKQRLSGWRSMASADFDEDGMPDLVSSCELPAGERAISLQFGNVDALWPYGKAPRNGEPPAFLEERFAVQRNGMLSVLLAQALNLEELTALQRKLAGKPSAVLRDVLTMDQMARLSSIMATAQQR